MKVSDTAPLAFLIVTKMKDDSSAGEQLRLITGFCLFCLVCPLSLSFCSRGSSDQKAKEKNKCFAFSLREREGGENRSQEREKKTRGVERNLENSKTDVTAELEKEKFDSEKLRARSRCFFSCDFPKKGSLSSKETEEMGRATRFLLIVLWLAPLPFCAFWATNSTEFSKDMPTVHDFTLGQEVLFQHRQSWPGRRGIVVKHCKSRLLVQFGEEDWEHVAPNYLQAISDSHSHHSHPPLSFPPVKCLRKIDAATKRKLLGQEVSWRKFDKTEFGVVVDYGYSQTGRRDSFAVVQKRGSKEMERIQYWKLDLVNSGSTSTSASTSTSTSRQPHQEQDNTEQEATEQEAKKPKKQNPKNPRMTEKRKRLVESVAVQKKKCIEAQKRFRKAAGRLSVSCHFGTASWAKKNGDKGGILCLCLSEPVLAPDGLSVFEVQTWICRKCGKVSSFGEN